MQFGLFPRQIFG